MIHKNVLLGVFAVGNLVGVLSPSWIHSEDLEAELGWAEPSRFWGVRGRALLDEYKTEPSCIIPSGTGNFLDLR